MPDKDGRRELPRSLEYQKGDREGSSRKKKKKNASSSKEHLETKRNDPKSLTVERPGLAPAPMQFSWASLHSFISIPSSIGQSFRRSLSVTFQHFPVKSKSQFRRLRASCGRIIDDPKVHIFIIACILINVIMIGVSTYPFAMKTPSISQFFASCDLFFLVIFTIELALQLVYRMLSFFTDAWLVFDLVIVSASWYLDSLQAFRSLRVFRAFRLVTQIDTFRNIVLSIAKVMPRMYAIMGLLLLIFYIFAVLFTELFGELELSENYFGTLDISLFTCMQLMTLEWAGICREVMKIEAYAWIPFLTFIMFTGFVVFNLIVAVVCDSVTVADTDKFEKEDEEEEQERQAALDEAVKVLELHVASIESSHAQVKDIVSQILKDLKK
jgi:hypothetical protein